MHLHQTILRVVGRNLGNSRQELVVERVKEGAGTLEENDGKLGMKGIVSIDGADNRLRKAMKIEDHADGSEITNVVQVATLLT